MKLITHSVDLLLETISELQPCAMDVDRCFYLLMEIKVERPGRFRLHFEIGQKSDIGKSDNTILYRVTSRRTVGFRFYRHIY